MSRALFIIDVQNDFVEGGALGVAGTKNLPAKISDFLFERRALAYDVIIASLDWHNSGVDNGGHFSETPDFIDTWPAHCVAGTNGAKFHPDLNDFIIDHEIRKGQGEPAYSIFEGSSHTTTTARLLDIYGVTDIDVCGIATDYCVKASALDAIKYGAKVRVITDLCAAVSPKTEANALIDMVEAGATLITSDKI